jgi:hypothetical protein
MECGGAVKAIRNLLLALLACIAGAGAVRAETSVALIVSAQSPITRLDSLEVRKLFLGFSVIREGRVLHALRNSSEPRIRNIFFQNIVAMSESTYERRVLAFALQQGQTRPLEFSDRVALIEAVSRDPTAVSFAFTSDVAGNPRIRILRVVWHD